MQSRMDRYNTIEKENETSFNKRGEATSSRQSKNQNLYKEVSNTEIENFDVNSNVSIIGESSNNINLEQVRDILEKRYKTDETKDKSIGDSLEEESTPINLDETREYDLNSVLKQAKSSKEVNYEEDRLRKLHNTQYDILMKLKLNKEKESENDDSMLNKKNLTIEEAESITSMTEIAEEDLKKASQNARPSEKELLDLIDTITSKETLIAKEEYPYDDSESLDPFDLLGDLKGDDDTRVLGALDLDKDKKEEDPSFKRKVKNTELKFENQEKKENNVEEEKEFDKEEPTQDIQLTKNKMFKTTDFEEFKDIRDDMKITKVLIKILIVILILVFLLGVVLLANKYLGLGLF